MNICNKCNIPKDDNQYETYWHSTRATHFTRRICNDCIKAQRAMYREMVRQKKIMATIASNEQIDPFKDQPGYKLCKECKKWKNTKTEWYSNKAGHTHTFCKFCTSIKERVKNAENRKIYLEENCGGNDVRVKPGVYIDEYQEDCVCNLMEAMGWTLNAKNNIWFKEGFKTKDGTRIKYNKNGVRLLARDPAYHRKSIYIKPGYKICKQCGEEKPMNKDYYPSKGTQNLKSICKDCYYGNKKEDRIEKKYNEL